MKLKLQRRLAREVMGVGKKRVKFPEENSKEIKEALTKSDIRKLINSGVIEIKQKGGKSKAHARYLKIQKRKGRRQGKGSREGKRTARLPRKKLWMSRIRIQRRFIKLLREKQLITTKDYRDLYLKSKSGAFRSKRHIKVYITEQGLNKNGKK